MHILHYSLGLPPYRSGGMTTWSTDLMSQQIEDGMEVSLLYPADIQLFRKKITTRKTKSYGQISVFELINPLPVALIYGIDSSEHYIRYDKSVDFSGFFDANKIDVIHIHTLMGLPIEFIDQAKKAGIRVMYTAHDMFGVWPDPDVNNRDSDAESIFSLGYIGNQKILRYSHIVMMQSTVYKLLKKHLPLEYIKKMLRQKNKDSGINTGISSSTHQMNRQLYEELRSHYQSYFKLIDIIHFNSELARDVFSAYGIQRPNFISYVYHSHMNSKPICSDTALGGHDKLRFLYNGTREQYKGYTVLLSILDELRAKGIDNFKLIVYGAATHDRDYIEARPPYDITNLNSVYSSVDVTIIPSMCYETFGMVVAESLSYGIPVIVSRTVGAKSLLANERYGKIFSHRSDLVTYLESILVDATELQAQRNAIKKSHSLRFDAKSQYNTIKEYYQSA